MATAPERYTRLEAPGLWRETPGDRGREVVAAFGGATLVLSDHAGRPLGHWALAGVSVLRREAGATVFAMGPEGGETLAIRDPEMVAAIATATRPGASPAPRRWLRRLRRAGVILLGAGVVAGVVAITAPRAVPTAARSLVPPGREGPLADALLAAIVARGGEPPCADPVGEAALARVAAAIDPVDPPTLRVVDLDGKPIVALPGRTLLLDRAALGTGDREEIAARARAALGQDATMAALQAAGPAADLRFAATGRFSDADLSRVAATLLHAESTESPAVADRPQAGIPAADWIAAGNSCG